MQGAVPPARQSVSPPHPVPHPSENCYSLGQISLGKLAELLDIPIEEAKAQLEKRGAPIDLGVSSEDELFRDIEDA